MKLEPHSIMFSVSTLHCACYDTSNTVGSLSELWVIKEVHFCPVTGLSELSVSGVCLEIETIVTDVTRSMIHITLETEKGTQINKMSVFSFNF